MGNPRITISPQTTSVVIVAHGDRSDPNRSGKPNPNQALAKLTTVLKETQNYLGVWCGVLKGEPTLEDALSQAIEASPSSILIYPFFMADGYFVNQVLPQRIAQFGLQSPHTICAPLGLDPALPEIIHKQVFSAVEGAKLNPKNVRLLLVGHGSKLGPASANATRRVAHEITQKYPRDYAAVDVAFLEEPPFLIDALQASDHQTFVSGFFNGDGLHAGEDVPKAIADAGTEAVYVGPIGVADEVSNVVAAALTELKLKV